MQVNVHGIYTCIIKGVYIEPALKGLWSIVFLSFVKVFTKLALRFGDAVKIHAVFISTISLNISKTIDS